MMLEIILWALFAFYCIVAFISAWLDAAQGFTNRLSPRMRTLRSLCAPVYFPVVTVYLIIQWLWKRLVLNEED